MLKKELNTELDIANVDTETILESITFACVLTADGYRTITLGLQYSFILGLCRHFTHVLSSSYVEHIHN